MLKFLGTKPIFKNLNKTIKNCRFKSRAEDYEIVNHLIDKKQDLTKISVPEAKYGGESIITILFGNDTHQGAEYIEQLFSKLHIPLLCEKVDVDEADYNRKDSVLSVLRNKYAINLDIVHAEGKKTEQSQMNNDLDLFAGIIRLFTIGGCTQKAKNVDTVMIIQNSAGDNTKLEYEAVKGLVETLKVTEERTLKKLVSYAFKYAHKNKRRKITLIHKVPYFPYSDTILLRLADMIGKNYPNIKIEKMDVDVAARELVEVPQNFDIICTNDRYGTMLTSILCGVCGGPQLFCCSNVGHSHAVFQPLQNKLSIPLPSNNQLSPYGITTSVVHLLIHMTYHKCADAIWKSMLKTTFIDNVKTPFLGGECTGKEVADRIIENLDESKCSK